MQRQALLWLAWLELSKRPHEYLSLPRLRPDSNIPPYLFAHIISVVSVSIFLDTQND